jgi:anti-anti-sigma factor
MEPDSQILAARTSEVVCLCIHGQVVADQCPALAQYVCEALTSGVRSVRINLRQCDYADSTFWGTLIQLRHATETAAPGGFALVAPSPPMQRALAGMGLARLFRVLEPPAAEETLGEWTVLTAERSSRSSFEFCQQVVRAHRALADSSETRGALYAGVADEAERELQRRTPSPAAE